MPRSPRASPSNNGRKAPVALTGVPGLDSVMAGGYPQGHVFLVQGHPGTGKTTLALQFLLEAMRQKERGLYITLMRMRCECWPGERWKPRGTM
jgi:circadian clock protein KaiC